MGVPVPDPDRATGSVPATAPTVADLDRILHAPDEGGADGVHWTLAAPGDLNTNLVRLSPGHRMDEHVNDEVDVLVVVLAGTGDLTVAGTRSPLARHVVAHVPRGTRRTIGAGADGLAYLTVHRRRGHLGIGPVASDERRPPHLDDASPGRTGTGRTGNSADQGGDPACWSHLFDDADPP